MFTLGQKVIADNMFGTIVEIYHTGMYGVRIDGIPVVGYVMLYVNESQLSHLD